MLWRTVADPLYSEYSAFEQNVLKWGALLHDIRKLGHPVYEGKDHIHPFKSAQSVLQLFVSLGFLKPSASQEASIRQVNRLIDESVQPVWKQVRDKFKHFQPVCTQMHSHHNLSEIFHYLWVKDKQGNVLMKRGSFHDLVFRIVMYHQSVEGCSEWPHMYVLSEHERHMFCDPPLFKVLKLLMIADSSSYNFMSDLSF